MKQVKFMDEENTILGGILLDDDETIICGCCGGTFEKEDITILKVYNYWVNISDEIIGEE